MKVLLLIVNISKRKKREKERREKEGKKVESEGKIRGGERRKTKRNKLKEGKGWRGEGGENYVHLRKCEQSLPTLSGVWQMNEILLSGFLKLRSVI